MPLANFRAIWYSRARVNLECGSSQDAITALDGLSPTHPSAKEEVNAKAAPGNRSRAMDDVRGVTS
jgi:hypothetical protein